MRVGPFCQLLHDSKYGKKDKKWFPRWIRKFAAGVKPVQGRLPVTVEGVIAFSRSLRDSGTPPWQRLQAVRAVEAYRDLILQTGDPSLNDIKLGRLADLEREPGTKNGVRNRNTQTGVKRKQETQTDIRNRFRRGSVDVFVSP